MKKTVNTTRQGLVRAILKDMRKIETKILNEFRNNNYEEFVIHLCLLIKKVYPRHVYLIKEKLKYENSEEAIDEILVAFLSTRYKTLKKRFRGMHLHSPEFMANLFLAIKHSIQDVLYNDETYKIKKRLRKEISKILSSNSLAELKYLRNKELKKKPGNILGISQKDIEVLLSIILAAGNYDKLILKFLTNSCYEYLYKNGYIQKISFQDQDDNKTGKDDDDYNLISDRQVAEKIALAIEKTLTSREKKIFYCLYVKDLPAKSVAKKLNMSEQLINYYRKKITIVLKEILKNYSMVESETDRKFFELIITNFSARYTKCYRYNR